MKSFFLSLLALITFLIPLTGHAGLYPLEVTKTPTSITIKMTGAPNNQSLYQLTDGATLIESSGIAGESMSKVAVNGTVTWTLTASALKQSGAYYFTVVQRIMGAPVPVSETKVVPAGTGEVASLLKDFSIVPSGDRKVTVSGKLDTTIYPNPRVLTVTFYSSQTGSLTDGPTNAGPLTAGVGGQSDIASDGSYVIVVSNLTPGAKYFFKQTISVNGSTTPLETKIDTFTTDKGYLIAGSVGEELDFNSRSYHLLAPLPGLSVLMDPDLCLEKKAKGEVPENAICDVNGFLDFAFKLLIGISAVMLVLRLMYEGYQYVVTDVPFLKASAKSGFFTALLGLLLALSAYLILNTINPKLVNNKITIDSVNVEVKELTYIDDNTFLNITGQKLKTKSEYVPVVKSIAAQEGIDACLVMATIQAESDWRASAIGCDEDVGGVPSNTAFVQSGIKYDGTKFTAGTSQRNGACKFDKSKPGFGLDWRFSKGGGLTQVTLFPVGYKSAAWYAGVKEGGSYWNSRTTPFVGWEKLVKPEDNIRAGIAILKQNKVSCGNDIQKIFRAYQTGSCNPRNGGDSALVAKTIQKKTSIYNDCKK